MSEGVQIALITTIGLILNGIIGAMILRKTNQTHDLVNGVSTKLAVAQTGKDRAEGFTEGEAAERDRGNDQ